LILTGGQFVNDAIKVIKDFGENALKAKILIFTFSIDMNRPAMTLHPEIVLCVNSFITGIMFEMNKYLNFTEVEFKNGRTFKDYANSRNEPMVKNAIDFNYQSAAEIPERIIFSCNSNKKSGMFGQF